jgi:hypothetical protein
MWIKIIGWMWWCIPIILGGGGRRVLSSRSIQARVSYETLFSKNKNKNKIQKKGWGNSTARKKKRSFITKQLYVIIVIN